MESNFLDGFSDLLPATPQNEYKKLSNLASIAMCLRWHEFPGFRDEQLEDVLFAKLSEHGLQSNDHESLRWLVNSYRRFGVMDDFRMNGSFSDIKDSIDNGNPVIVAGLWMRSGEAFVCSGYGREGLTFQIPGKGIKGRNFFISYKDVSPIISPESMYTPSNIWMHTISKIRRNQYLAA
jgi:hypothetical protein